MARFEIGTVPQQLRDMGKQVALWCNELVKRTAAAETTKLGTVLMAEAVADLNQTISDPPTQAEVQAISDKIDALLAAQRTAGQLEE